MAFNYTEYLNQLLQNAATGTGTTTRPSDQITSMYDTQKAAQEAALKAAYEQSLASYTAQETQAQPMYQAIRDEASTNAALQQRALMESVANMGLSSAGGTSQTLQQRNTNNLMNTMGDASRQQQAYLDEIALAKSDLGTQYQSDLTTSAASYDAQKLQALLEQSQYEQSVASSAADNLMSTYLNLLSMGKITSAQFKAATGIDASTATSGSSGGSSGSSATTKYNAAKEAGISEADAIEYSGDNITSIYSGYTGAYKGQYYVNGQPVTEKEYRTYKHY